jgi:predicted DNA-binding transcriptional regulator AlpA
MVRSLQDDVCQIDEVAAALGRSPAWLRRNWVRIANEDGFPRRHPTGWTWPRAAVAAWLRGASSLPASANDNGAGDVSAAYEAALNQAYGVQP